MKEKISSLVDDELDEQMLVRELDGLTPGSAELAAYERYHRVGAALRGELPASEGFANGELSARIARALKDEPTRIAPAVVAENAQRHADVGVSRGTTASGWFGAAAIAATVAAVVVFGLNSGPVEPLRPNSPAIATTGSNSSNTATTTVPTGSAKPDVVKWETGTTQWRFVADSSASKPASSSNGANMALNALLVEHAEFVPASGMNGLSAYVRFVSYDNDDARTVRSN